MGCGNGQAEAFLSNRGSVVEPAHTNGNAQPEKPTAPLPTTMMATPRAPVDELHLRLYPEVRTSFVS